MPSKDRSARIREQVLREWRGIDEPVDLDAGIQHPEQQIQTILKRFGIQEGLDEQLVKSTWRQLAGDFIADHSQPHSVKNGELVLHVTQPAMRFHLNQMKPLLLDRLREQLGREKVRAIRFSHG